jgi:hypothetical protein
MALSMSACAVEDGGDDTLEVTAVVGGLAPEAAKLKSGSVTFVDNGMTLTANGKLNGLGSTEATVRMTATANVVLVCTSPSGTSQPKGKRQMSLSAQGAIPATMIKNGTATFSLTTLPPETLIIDGAPDCPNAKWTESIADLAFTGASITVEQKGATVPAASCAISPASSDGAVPAGSVVCK